MICTPGLDCASYWQTLSSGSTPKIPCPSCEHRHLRGHGWYERRIDGQTVRLRRLRCPRCRETHALLPEDLCAYRDLKLDAVEHTLEGTGDCTPKEHRQGGADWIEGRCRDLFFILPATAHSLLDRVRVIVGTADGSLVRLRHWLWRRFAFFFSGLAGLFRRGQPHHHFRRSSTHFGACLQP